MKHGRSEEQDRFADVVAERKAEASDTKPDSEAFSLSEKELMSPDYLMALMVTAFEMERLCRREVLFQVDEEIGTDNFRRIRAKFVEEVGRKIRTKYEGCKVRILNEELA